MKTIEVSSAIIIKENKIFISQRSYGDFKDRWEFPGGKLESGESGKECVVREIKEELDADIKVTDYLGVIEYTYPLFHLKMHNYICELIGNHIVMLEHEAAKFVDFNDLDKYDFLPADLLVIDKLRDYLSNR